MSNVDKIAKDLAGIIKSSDNKATAPYDTKATVKKVENGIAWVQIPGGVDETPVQMTLTAKEGDTVQVRVAGGRAWITGNGTAPPTDDARANDAYKAADKAYSVAENAIMDARRAHEAADSAEASAGAAKESAENAGEYAARALGNLSTVQSVTETLNWITAHGTMTITTDTALDPTHVYFVADASGDYIVGGNHYSIVTEPKLEDISTYYVLSIDESLNNYVGTHLALTEEGLWIIPEAGGNRILVAPGGQGHTYESAGTYIIDSAGKTVAKLGEVITLGKSDGSRSYLKLDYRSMQMIDNDARAYLHISNLIDSDGNVCEEFNGTGRSSDREYTVSFNVTDVASVKVNGVATQDYTRSGNTFTFTRAWPLGPSETLEIKYKTTVQTTWYAKSYTLGFRKGSSAIGVSSFVLGLIAAARGFASFAEGYSTEANANYSHAQNIGTIASSDNQTAIGSYNIEDDEDSYALIIGNGTADNARSNALTVAWDGNVELALDTTAASGTTDGDLYAAIVALGWQNDVIE